MVTCIWACQFGVGQEVSHARMLLHTKHSLHIESYHLKEKSSLEPFCLLPSCFRWKRIVKEHSVLRSIVWNDTAQAQFYHHCENEAIEMTEQRCGSATFFWTNLCISDNSFTDIILEYWNCTSKHMMGRKVGNYETKAEGIPYPIMGFTPQVFNTRFLYTHFLTCVTNVTYMMGSIWNLLCVLCALLQAQCVCVYVCKVCNKWHWTHEQDL